jgi:hypothetical protein
VITDFVFELQIDSGRSGPPFVVLQNFLEGDKLLINELLQTPYVVIVLPLLVVDFSNTDRGRGCRGGVAVKY